LYGKQGHIDTSQLNGIFKVKNFYDIEDIPVVSSLFVRVTKHFKLYTCVHTAAGVMTWPMHVNRYAISLYMEMVIFDPVETSFVC
jgi:hypothetical protein